MGIRGIIANNIVKSALRDMPKRVPKYGQLELFPRDSAKQAADRFAVFMRDSQAVAPVNASAVKPLRLYHATPEQFDSFKFNAAPGRIRRHALFAAEDPEYAQTYVKAGGEYSTGANVLPIYASIRNPLDMTDEGLGAIPGHEADRLKQFGINLDVLAGQSRYHRWHALDREQGKERIDGLKAAGYDGVKLQELFSDVVSSAHPRHGDVANVWAAFDPTQFKSVFNRGSFSVRDPHLRKARGGRVSSFAVRR